MDGEDQVPAKTTLAVEEEVQDLYFAAVPQAGTVHLLDRPSALFYGFFTSPLTTNLNIILILDSLLRQTYEMY